MPKPVVLFLAVIALAGCGGTSKSAPTAASPSPAASSGSTTTSAATSTDSAAVNPNAPDVNTVGDIPDNQVFTSFTFAAGPFALKVPEGWARTDNNGTTTFTDNFNSVGLQIVAATSAPTTQSARDSEVPAIQSSVANFQLDNVTTVTRKAGSAVLITYRADSAPNPVTGKVRQLAVERYEFWQNGKEAVVVLSGPVGADNVDPFRIITDSFAWS